MLWACLLLPSLPLDVFARAIPPAEPPRPFAVTTGGHYPRLVAVDSAARTAGLAPGQLVSAALALAPNVALRDRDPRLEAAALEGVAIWTTQFTPAVSLAPPDALLCEIGGSLRLFGGIERIAAEIADGARALGYAARLALAATPLAALAFARAERDARHSAAHAAVAGPRVLPLSALYPLSLACFDVAPDVLATLAAAGVATFGEACALPRDALARRVGAAFVAMLDRARGSAPDPRPPFAPPASYEGRLDLPAPVANAEALAFAANRLVHELAGWLVGRGLGALEMSLALAHERYARARTGVPVTTVEVALAAPSREPAHLLALLRERLSRVELPAPVERVTLASGPTAALAGRNRGLLPGDETAATVPLVDRLRARLGDDAVTLVAPRAEHRPERASAAEKNGVRLQFSVAGPHTGSPRRKFACDPAFPPRPVWLLAEPVPLGPLVEAQPWVLRDGPERIESGWWDGTDVRRDYFVAESPRGELLWVFRDHRRAVDDGEWFLHGVFG